MQPVSPSSKLSSSRGHEDPFRSAARRTFGRATAFYADIIKCAERAEQAIGQTPREISLVGRAGVEPATNGLKGHAARGASKLINHLRRLPASFAAESSLTQHCALFAVVQKWLHRFWRTPGSSRNC